jgi:hypothetical protein
MAVILYEGLTGRLPFEADTVGDLLVQLMTKEPPTMRDVEPSIPKALSEMVAQAMSKSREHRFADARAMRRALLASAESAVPPGRRAAASVPPPVAGVPPTAGASLPIQSNAIASRGPNADTSAATWGDFEGLDAAQILDNSPPILSHPPSLVPPESPKQQRVVARLADELSLGERPDKQPVEAKRSGGGNVERNKPERAAGDRVSGAQANAAGRNRKSGKKPSAAAAAGGGLDVALDPLYVGADQAAPDIDFDRMPASARKAQSQAKPAQRPRAKPRAELPQQRVRYKRNFWPWVLPAVALFLLGYMFWQPSLGSLPESGSQVGSAVAKGAADTGLGRVRLQVKARRERPGQAPPHMRDVVF